MGRHPGVRRPRPRRPAGRPHRRPAGRRRPRRRPAAPAAQRLSHRRRRRRSPACATCSTNCAGAARRCWPRATPTAAWPSWAGSSTRSSRTSAPPSTSSSRRRPPRATSAASEVTDDVATERRMALDLQPDDPAGRIQSLQHYDFVSSEARERFEELVEELRREMADTFFEGASDALSNMDPEQMARMRDAYDALNRMLEQREAGRGARPELRGVHGAVRRHVPGQPAEPRRAARAAGRAHGGGPGGVELARAPSSRRSCAGSWRRCSRTWTCAGRWSAWPRTSSGPSPTPAGSARTTSTARAR